MRVRVRVRVRVRDGLGTIQAAAAEVLEGLNLGAHLVG